MLWVVVVEVASTAGYSCHFLFSEHSINLKPLHQFSRNLIKDNSVIFFTESGLEW